MEKKYRDALNAKGKVDVFYFDPADAVLVKDKTSALYDERVDNDFNEALVLNMLYAPDDGAPQGVIEPCIGRRNSETGKVEIVDGRQRTLACREANRRLKKQGAELLRLPVLLKRANDVRAMAMLVSANEHRTADSPLGRAAKAQRYIDLGRTPAEVGTLLGVSAASVKNLLSLLDAPAAVKGAVESGKISVTDGYKLAKLDPTEARGKVAELVEHAPRTPGKKRSKNAKRAREIVSGKPTAAPEVREDWDTAKVEDRAAKVIADWIERNWVDGWDGDPKKIPERIRAGDWRPTKKVEAAE
jgi:ParB family chromosome partitioning protein